MTKEQKILSEAITGILAAWVKLNPSYPLYRKDILPKDAGTFVIRFEDESGNNISFLRDNLIELSPGDLFEKLMSRFSLLKQCYSTRTCSGGQLSS